MTFLQKLKKAAKSDVATFTKFLQQFSFQNNYLHIFHEGEDDPSFYLNYIEQFTKKNQRIYFYKCSGKKAVYENHSKVNWQKYKKQRILFFVDKDFSDLLEENYLQDTNIFVTRYYSIENYLVTKSMFSKCLRDLVGLDDDERNEILSRHFERKLKDFYNSSLILTAYILFHRKQGNKPNLSNIKFNKVFDLKEDLSIERKPKLLSTLDNLLNVQTNTAYPIIKKIAKAIQNTEPKKYVRGKYEIMFFVECLNKIPKLLNAELVKGKPKFSLCVNISKTNAVKVIAPRLRQPTDVKTFLRENLK